ncbi:MAG: 16S rRNA (cytosine(1402)-N(4))-methyltransferase RsmH [Parvibaculales bacterium]
MNDRRTDFDQNERLSQRPHIPVLLDQVIQSLSPEDGDIIIDGTFGAGGYTRAILESADCAVIAIDRDPDAIERGQAMKQEFGQRLQLVQGCFGDMQEIASGLGHDSVNGITLDLGVSSMQLDEAERGFSFMRDGPLDMRMAQQGMTAADLVNELPETELARIIAVYGEEKKARAIARAIARHRTTAPITRTGELAALIEGVLGGQRFVKGARRAHPATRSFQALRIYLNDELGELMRALETCERLLAPDGRLAIVTFHSLEDRMVKKFFALRTGRLGQPSRHQPIMAQPENSFAEIRSRRQDPTDAEITANPRARSARLRAVKRTDAPAIDTPQELLPRMMPVFANRSYGGEQ